MTHSTNAEYAAILRTAGVDVMQVSRAYFTALTLIRDLVRLDGLTDEQKVAEIGLVFSGLARVQEALDDAEVDAPGRPPSGSGMPPSETPAGATPGAPKLRHVDGPEEPSSC